MEGSFHGEEVDVPAASFKCVRSALWCGDGCGTTLPHLGLSIVQRCAIVQSLSGASLLHFPLPTSSLRHFGLPALG